MQSPCRSRWPAKPLSGVASGALLFASAVLLQGCDIFGGGGGSSSSQSGKEKESKERVDYTAVNGASDSVGVQDEMFCREEVYRASEQFLATIENEAPKYLAAIKKEFTDGYVKYPFCLENRRYQVWKTQKALRATDTGSKLAGDKFESAVEKRIQANFRQYQGDYEKYCQEWANENIQWQTDKAEIVAKVLSLEPDDVKQEIDGFFNWHTWWSFFESMQNSGCMTKYVDECATPVKEAHRFAIEKLRTVTGDGQMHWLFYPDNPHDVLGISSKKSEESSSLESSDLESSSLESSSLAERSVAKRWRKPRDHESITPVELRPTGHMLLRH